jgi:prevent-host-death family protein
MQPVFEIEINRYIEHWQSSSCFEKPALPAFPLFPPQLLHDLIVNIGDLKAQLSAHIQFVRDGEEVLVCDRNKPVARIVPCRPEGDSEQEQRLIARDVLTTLAQTACVCLLAGAPGECFRFSCLNYRGRDHVGHLPFFCLDCEDRRATLRLGLAEFLSVHKIPE